MIQLAATSSEILYIINLSTHLSVLLNRRIHDQLGLTLELEDEKGSDFLMRLMHPEDAGRMSAMMDPLLAAADEDVINIEYRLRHADGEYRWLSCRCVVFQRDDADVPFLALCAANDVTELRQDKGTLQDKAVQLQAVLDTAVDAILTIDEYGTVETFNHAAERMFGYTAEEVLGHNVKMLMPAPYHAEHDGYLQRYLETGNGNVIGIGREVLGQRKDGSTLPLELAVSEAWCGRRMFTGMLRDLTARNQTYAALQESEEHLRFAMEAAAFGAWDMDLKTNVVRRSLRHDQIFGYSKPVAVWGYDTFLAHVHPEDRAFVDENYRRAMAGRGDYDVVFRAVWPDGTIRSLWSKGRFYHDTDGKPYRVAGIQADVTEREQAKARLDESAAFNAAILNSLSAQIAMLDSEGIITAVNDEYVRFARENGGATDRTGIIGINYLNVCQEAIGKESADEAEQAALGLRAVMDGTLPVFNLEYPCHSPKEKRWFRMRVTPVENEHRSVLVAHEDITLQHQLREQLIESQKLESLGRLAGGVAHDFNNLLTAILGYTELCLDSLPDAAEERPFMNNVRAAAERAATLTQQLLMYARRQMVEFHIVDINDIILNIYPLLRRTVGEHYELVIALEDGGCHVSANSSQMEQVLTNLVVNARDAMPNGGRILIETSCVILDAEYAERHIGVAPGEYVMYSVSDNGIGMTREVRNRIFEPFFTTKEVGRGTGLGLATCYGIVKQSKGNIWVYSEPGSGTTFKVYLPRVHEKVQESPVQPVDISLPGSETVLVVDDEPMVRDIVARTLRARGYRVLEASSGAEALHLQRESMVQIDLLITDVVMPLMGGKELAQHLQAVCPAMKVLYMSGYTQNVILQYGVLKPDFVLIIKPFTARSLFEKVREALDG
jgi:PAS domain S-box-containing protein